MQRSSNIRLRFLLISTLSVCLLSIPSYAFAQASVQGSLNTLNTSLSSLDTDKLLQDTSDIVHTLKTQAKEDIVEPFTVVGQTYKDLAVKTINTHDQAASVVSSGVNTFLTSIWSSIIDKTAYVLEPLFGVNTGPVISQMPTSPEVSQRVQSTQKSSVVPTPASTPASSPKTSLTPKTSTQKSTQVSKPIPQVVYAYSSLDTSLRTLVLELQNRVRALELAPKAQNITTYITQGSGSSGGGGGISVASFTGLSDSFGKIIADNTSTLRGEIGALRSELLTGTGDTSFSTSTTRSAFSALGPLTYATSTGVFSVASGYEIPLTASTTEWANKVGSQWATHANGTDIFYNGGNVGIGTTDPSSNLSVYDDGDAYAEVESLTGESVFGARAHEGDALTRYYISEEIDWSVGFDYSDSNKFKISQNARPGENDYFTIDTAGNVGIGTTDPEVKLDVLGAMRVSDDDEASFQLRQIDNDNVWSFLVGNDGGFKIQKEGLGGGLAFELDSNRSATFQENMYVLGNVGIGTTTPSQKLVVAGNVVADAFYGDGSNLTGISSTSTPSVGGAGLVQFASSTAGYFDSSENFSWDNTLKKLSLSTPSVSAYSFSTFPTTAARTDGGSYSLGYTFQVTTPITVSRLGRLYVAGNTQDHGARIYNNTSGALLASGTILAASASDSNNYKWVSVAPIVLSPGITYSLSIDEYALGDTWKDLFSVSLQPFFINIDAAVGGFGGKANTTGQPNRMFSTGAMDYSYTLTTAVSYLGVNTDTLTVNTNFQANGITPPSDTLTVFGNTTINKNLLIGDITTAFGAIETRTSLPSPAYATFGANGAPDVFRLARIGGGVNAVQSGYDALTFYTSASAASSGTEKMRVTIGGNVGIGTTNPSARLHIESTTEQLRSGYSPTIYWNAATAVTTGITTFDAVGGTTPSFVFNDNTNIVGRLKVQKVGFTSEEGGIEVNTDPGNPTVNATFLLPPTNGGRFYFGKSGLSSFSVNFGNVTTIEAMPTFATSDGFQWGSNTVISISRSGTDALYRSDFFGKHIFRVGGGGGVGSDALVIDATAKVGIGTSSPAYPLDVYASGSDVARFVGNSGGAQCIVVAGTGFSCSSDQRLKQNIHQLEGSLDKILALSGVRYNWNIGDIDTTQVGFIAQDVEQVIPELVRTDKNGFKSLLYAQVGPYLVEAIKELAQKFSNITAWFSTGGDKLQVQGMICVDDVCVTKGQFKQMLLNAGSVTYSNSAPTSPPQTPTPTPEPVPTPPSDPAPAPEPEPSSEETPPASEPTPEPEQPSPAPTFPPDPAPIPEPTPTL